MDIAAGAPRVPVVGPGVTVIIPAYNAARFLRRTIDSVRQQTFQDWELVVVDDGSTDATPTIAEACARLDRRIRLVRQHNAGVANARNQGLHCAAGSSWALLFLDADDLLETDALGSLVTALAGADARAVGAHGLVRLIDADGQLVRAGEAEAFGRDRFAIVDGRMVRWPKDRPTTLSALILANYIYTPGAMLVRRSAVEALEGFDPDPAVTIAEDWDLWLRLACRGDVVFLDRVVLDYRVHHTGLSSNARAMDRARWYVHDKLLRRTDLTRDQRILVKQARRSARLLSSRNWTRWAQRSLSAGRLPTAAIQGRHALIELLHAWRAV